MTASKTSGLIDRASAYGDGVFETIAIRNGEPRFWSAHAERLQTSCSRLGIACPGEEQLLAAMHAALQNSAVDPGFATARLVICAADSARGYQRAKNGGYKMSLDVFAAAALPRELLANGVAVRRCNLRLAIQPVLAGIKSLNRLEQVLARAEWNDTDHFEGLLLDLDGRLICGTMSNVFLVHNSTVVTPAITRCGVSGVMRGQVLQLLREAGVSCDVRDVAAGELEGASECFLTNSQFGVIPVQRCDQIEWAIGAVTRQAQSLIAEQGVPECLA
jgi:4-amino-4-deoxychorismate lyase